MSKNNVVKFRTPIQINPGIVVFFIMFIFLSYHVIKAFNTDVPSVYTVQESYIDNNISGMGLILRSETLVNADKAGYINYYIRDGEKVAKGSTIYTVDETGAIKDYLSDVASDQTSLTTDNYREIRNRISMFNSYFTPSNFQDIYDFKYDLQTTVMELSNETLIEQLTQVDANALTNTFQTVPAAQSATITYYQDGYETKTLESLTKADFDEDAYSKQTLKSNEIIGAGEPVYKMLTSEHWNIVLPISTESYELIKEDTRATIRIPDVDHDVYCDLSFHQIEDQQCAVLSLNGFLSNYAADRFLPVEIVLDADKGLKIPNSSIIEKDVYLIPLDYLSSGSNSTEAKFFNIKTMNEKGEISITQVDPAIYKKEDSVCYVNPLDFPEGAVLVKNNSDETINISSVQTKKISGVYSANKGIATFKQIEILDTSDEYTIVKKDTQYGIALYDHIILNSTTINENEIIH